MKTTVYTSFLGEIGRQVEIEHRRPKEEETEFQARFKKNLVEIEKKIAKELDKHRDLSVLTSAGVERKLMLRFLALAADAEGDKEWADLMRLRQEALKSIAGRMETLAREAEKRAIDPLSVVQTWAFLCAHGGVLGMKWPKPLKESFGVEFTITGMRALAKTWKKEAIKFGRFLDTYGDRRTNLAVPLLLIRVCVSLRKPEPGYWNELATLLTDAFEAAGKSKRFSADWLRKVWKRHGKRMLGMWIKLNTESPPEQNPVLPPVSFHGLSPRLGQTSQD